uniref:Uncharacterized protein n=1 Tax=Lotus japonicus TaxID=34305 RepID=I3SSX5_LOTJA|nr:unknown [Lotus japonicus]
MQVKSYSNHQHSIDQPVSYEFQVAPKLSSPIALPWFHILQGEQQRHQLLEPLQLYAHAYLKRFSPHQLFHQISPEA